MIGLPEVAKARRRGRRVGGLFAIAAILGSVFAAHRAWLCLYMGKRLLAEVELSIIEREGHSP